jgi:hypothetical protein
MPIFTTLLDIHQSQKRSRLSKNTIINGGRRENTPSNLRILGNKLSIISDLIKGKDNILTFGFTCYILNEVLETPLRSVILEALESKADFKTPFEYGGEDQEVDLRRQLFTLSRTWLSRCPPFFILCFLLFQ